MKIVIDIPKQAYEVIKRNALATYAHNLALLTEWIANGIPLPKEHGRLIDADALKKEAVVCPTVGYAETLLLDISDVENAPTIIEADKEGAEE